MSLMKQVEYSRDAAKMLQRIDRVTARGMRDKVRQYAEDPGSLANNVIIMKGGGDLRRMRVGDWRVIFTEDLVVVLVIRIAPRGGAYD
jgi:mRNA interferase RelE/StbE